MFYFFCCNVFFLYHIYLLLLQYATQLLRLQIILYLLILFNKTTTTNLTKLTYGTFFSNSIVCGKQGTIKHANDGKHSSNNGTQRSHKMIKRYCLCCHNNSHWTKIKSKFSTGIINIILVFM